MRTPGAPGPSDGYSLVEMLVAMCLMLTVTASIFGMMNPSHGVLLTDSEAADMQQRLRVATDRLYNDLLMAGGGPDRGAAAGPLNTFLAPIVPHRRGRINGDPPGTFRADTVTLLHVPSTTAQTSIRDSMPAQSGAVRVNADPGCPPDTPTALCAFEAGMGVVIYDDTGSYDHFTIARVRDGVLHLEHNMNDHWKLYPPGSTIVEAASHTYYLKTDDATQTYQLMRYDGALSDVPAVDHVVALDFEYFGDPQPPRMRKPLSDPGGHWSPWTTYGPKPPPLSQQTTAWPAGENCVFSRDGTRVPASRLPVLGPDHTSTALVVLTAAQLSDGPWCPDVNSPNRFDADLLRIRKVAVRLRVQAAVASLRGPASALFAKGGTSQSSRSYLPDRGIRFDVTPRNLNLGR